MGHSFGGTLTQILLDHGCGAVGVAIDSAPTEGVHVSPPSQIKSLFPILKNPANRHKAVGFTPEEFHYASANTLSEDDSRKVYDRYHIPAPGNWVWRYGLIANFKPGHQETWVNYKDDGRAPLLFIAGGEDHIMPPSVTSRTPSATRPTPSPTTTSSPAARTGRVASLAGKRSPTSRSSGRSSTPARGRSPWPARRRRAESPGAAA